jgi:hypothetical protein
MLKIDAKKICKHRGLISQTVCVAKKVPIVVAPRRCKCEQHRQKANELNVLRMTRHRSSDNAAGCRSDENMATPRGHVNDVPQMRHALGGKLGKRAIERISIGYFGFPLRKRCRDRRSNLNRHVRIS